jgi:hypothetical protein
MAGVIYPTAHDQWLSKTRSIPYWTTSFLSSAVTDLVLIYELVTSSASVVLWLTLHSRTLNLWIHLRLNHHWTLLNKKLNSRLRAPFHNFGRTEYKSPCLTISLLFCFSVFEICRVTVTLQWRLVAAGTCLPNCCLAMVIFRLNVTETCVSEPLAINELFRNSCIVTLLLFYVWFVFNK